MNVKIAKTEAEYQAVRELRHRVNFMELGKGYLFDNQEEIDENATYFMLKKRET